MSSLLRPVVAEEEPVELTVLDPAEREAVEGVLHRLERRWDVLPIPADEWHAYDPLPFWEFIRLLREARTVARGRRFLDVGCGVGRNLAVAYHLGWDVSGIELRARYADAARELVPEAEITVANMLDVAAFDADVVYLYGPARADATQRRAERHLLHRVTFGTVVVMPLRSAPIVVA